MNTTHLKYMLAIAKHKNISNAAKELFISQPALTKTLNHLEEQYGLKLFDRSRTPITPTYAGTVFLEEAQKLLDMERHLDSQMKLLANGKKSRISFGIPGGHGTMYLPAILSTFATKYPDITVDVTEAHIRVLEEKMLNGDVDISFATLPVSLESLDYQILFDDPIVIAASRTSRFASQFDLDGNTLHTPYLIPKELLDGEYFNSGSPDGGMYRIAQELFIKHSIHPATIRTFYRHETAVRMSALDENLVVTPCVSIQSTPLEKQLAFFTLDAPVFCRKKIVCYRKNQLLPPESVLMIQVIREVVRENASLVVRSVEPIEAVYGKSHSW